MITVTEEARELFTTAAHPEGTILRLGPVTDERVRVGPRSVSRPASPGAATG